MGTQLKFSTAYHSETDGQTERKKICSEHVSLTFKDPGVPTYANLKRRHVELEVGDHLFLRVTPRKGISVKRFGKKGKLSPRYVGTFEILDRVGNVAYRVALPPSFSEVHNVFHVSQLKKYVSDPSHVMSYETLGLQEDLSFDERLVKILDRKDKLLRNKTISFVKVLWRNNGVEEATWEFESDMLQQYSKLFE
ncbi:uncharacterized protein LOC133792252 [Humulus lupulus]|uniref:uncharacterized protein LOC133792252 n=1 Tax=Humulus lupulus TaxID=3486 RepID=UPI002B404179|nr:uncharacterized protein LOC133792252 [Humulus lupulus]